MKHTLNKLDTDTFQTSEVVADIMRLGRKLTENQKLETTNISFILLDEAGNRQVNHYMLKLDANATIHLRNELNDIIKNWVR